MRFFECADGSEALAIYQQHLPDWVLMDWEMPAMNGITATREIIGKFPNANIYMLTAFADEDTRAEAFRACASGLVFKQ